MNEREIWLYRVSHPDHETVEFPAEDRLRAIQQAARAWGVPWTTVARASTIERLSPVLKKAKKAAKKEERT